MRYKRKINNFRIVSNQTGFIEDWKTFKYVGGGEIEGDVEYTWLSWYSFPILGTFIR